MIEKLKVIKIIHLFITIGMIIVYAILGDVTTLDFLSIPAIDTSSIIYLGIPVLAVFVGNLLYQQQIKNVDEKFDLEEKIPVYQTATIIRLAILEGAAFLILFLAPDFVLVGILLICYMIYLRPTEDQFRRDFERNSVKKL